MRQAIHILKKDVRHLWIEIAACLTAAAVLAFTGVRQSQWLTRPEMTRVVTAALVNWLLPLAWITLIVRAIHSEALPGDRQFWTTRPYSWKSLLAAKAMLVVLFVNVPLAVAQAIIVRAYGFSVGGEVASLLWEQALIVLAVVLPIAAVAAVTAGFVQFLLVALVSFAAVVLLTLPMIGFGILGSFGGADWSGFDWVASYYDLALVTAAAATILVWQYRSRRTPATRTVAVTAVVLLFVPMPFGFATAFALQSRIAGRRLDESKIRAGFRSDFKWAARALVEPNGVVSLSLPLEITGLAADFRARPEGLTATIEGPGGAMWRTDSWPRGNVSQTGQLIDLRARLDRGFYETVKDAPVRIRGVVYITLFGNHRDWKVPFDGRHREIPGMGMCTASGGTSGRPYFLICYSAFRPWNTLFWTHFAAGGTEPITYVPGTRSSYSPFPAELEINPMRQYMASTVSKEPLDAVTVGTVEPVSFVRAALEIDGLRLRDFEARLVR